MSIAVVEKREARRAGVERPGDLPAIKTPELPQEIVADNGVLPLESGDHLSRAEFERRYEAHPEIKKAELIEGVVYVSSPVRVRRHGAPHSNIIGWLTFYQAATPGINVADNTTLRLDLENEPQPDVCVWVESGGAFVDEDDYLAGAPELIVEVAASSASYDLHNKLRVYRRNSVQEYLVLLTYEQEARWYSFQGGETRLIAADDQRVLHSQVLPGLHLHSALFWQGDLAGVLAILQQGLGTPEHVAFAEQLRR
jgi:Uma2 family endonuclease